MQNLSKSKKIFVTGATGFIGSYIVRFLLHRGYNNIIALRRASSQDDMTYDFQDQITWVEGDILDQELMIETVSDVDWVFHAAAVISFEKNRVETMMQVNVEGTKNIVESCKENPKARLLHISSIAAIGRPWDKRVYSEDDIWTMSKDVHMYSVSKFKAEQEVWRGIAEGMTGVIVNPSVVIGAGRWNEATNLFFSKIHSGFKFVPQGKTGFVDVRDVAQLSVSLLEKEIHSERFILNGENASYEEFLGKIARAFQVKPPQIILTNVIGGVAWRFAAIARTLGFDIALTRDVIRSINSESIFSNEKICGTMNYSFKPLSKTVEEICAAFLASREKKIAFLSFKKL